MDSQNAFDIDAAEMAHDLTVDEQEKLLELSEEKTRYHFDPGKGYVHSTLTEVMILLVTSDRKDSDQLSSSLRSQWT